MKKHPIAISAVAFFLLTTGCRTSQEEDVVDAPVRKRECRQPLTLEAVSEQNVHGVWQGKTAPYLHSGGFSIEGDFIYWRVDEDDLDYVMTSNLSKSTLHKPEISWGPGFKVGVGYTWENHDFWDLFLRWTRLNTHQDGEKKAELDDPSHRLIPIWSPTVLGEQAVHASVNWHVRYNTLDLELGRNYFVGKNVALRPCVGLRGASILQHYRAKYHSELTTLIEDLPLFHTDMKAQNNFRGLGARAGALLKWHFTSGFALIGSVGGSLLYGWYDLHQKLEGFRVSTEQDFRFKDNFSKLATNLEASLGLEWGRFFCDDDYRIAISASYEFSEWFSQNRMKQFNLVDNLTNLQLGISTVGSGNGDLGLQGGTLQVRFDF